MEICGEDEAAGLKLFCTVWETCEVAEPGKLWQAEPVSVIFAEGELELLALPEMVSEIRGEGEGVPLKLCGEAVGNGEKVSSCVSVICGEAETDAEGLPLAAAVPVLSCVSVAVFRAVRV